MPEHLVLHKAYTRSGTRLGDNGRRLSGIKRDCSNVDPSAARSRPSTERADQPKARNFSSNDACPISSSERPTDWMPL